MADLKTTAVGNGNVTPDGKRIVVDMADSIAFLEPSANPLVVLTKKASVNTCHNPKYEWLENDLDTRWVEVGTAATAAATSVALTSGQGAYVKVGDLLKVPGTYNTAGEIMRVTAIATDTLTVTRDIGGNAAGGGALAKNAKLLIVGDSSMQGSGAPAENVVGVSALFNYTQIFKTAFSITNTLDATTLYGMKEMARLRKMAGIQHAKSMEYAFLFGAKSNVTTGAQPITTTEGIVTTLADCGNNKTFTAANFTNKNLMSFCEGIFQYGGSERTCLCSPDMLSAFAELANNKLQLIQSDMDKTLGLNITRYLTPHGVLNLVLHPLLRTGYGGYMIALSMDDIAYRPLQGRDTKLMTNIQANDEDGERDQYITEAGIMIKNKAKHGILTVTA